MAHPSRPRAHLATMCKSSRTIQQIQNCETSSSPKTRRPATAPLRDQHTASKMPPNEGLQLLSKKVGFMSCSMIRLTQCCQARRSPGAAPPPHVAIRWTVGREGQDLYSESLHACSCRAFEPIFLLHTFIRIPRAAAAAKQKQMHPCDTQKRLISASGGTFLCRGLVTRCGRKRGMRPQVTFV